MPFEGSRLPLPQGSVAPSKIPSPVKPTPLSESKSANIMPMDPPKMTTTGLKKVPVTGVTRPITTTATGTRKTLAERAGETRSMAAPPRPSSRTATSASATSATTTLKRSQSVKGISRVAAAATSISRTTTTRPASALGTARPPSAASTRPTSAAGTRPTSATSMRPGSSGSASSKTSTTTASAPGGTKAKRPAWDTKGRLEDMESAYAELRTQFVTSKASAETSTELLESERRRIAELELGRVTLTAQRDQLEADVARADRKVKELTEDLDAEKRARRMEAEDSERAIRMLRDDLERRERATIDELNRRFREEIATVESKAKRDIEDMQSRAEREIHDAFEKTRVEKERVHAELEIKDRELKTVKTEFASTQAAWEAERHITATLRQTVAEQSAAHLALETQTNALKARSDGLEGNVYEMHSTIQKLREELAEAQHKQQAAETQLITEETIRRKLHNQIQELKGNIRVFCRVRPPLEKELGMEGGLVEMKMEDQDSEGKEIELVGTEEKTAMGGVKAAKSWPFSFDKVFNAASANQEVFEEISQLVQSALDGYNVCIFAYGQTGSGKTYTMSSDDGMIPRAVHQIYSTAEALRNKGWTYTMEGQFLEIYNETINDLLGKAEEFDKKKHEIRHDKGTTIVTDLTSVPLDTPGRVATLLKRASNNRSVAATHANERSSRSHSVFMLHLRGTNSVTGEKSQGTLNLIDLAGSERLNHSGSFTGDRLKETQAINKSLSCLGDVIYALGSGKEGGHVPYRNSKAGNKWLTYLLQNSLGGNSKTLMFVNISPLQQHLNETLCSLRFATKVNSTSIGVPKKRMINA
ncbi:kinesin-domain-containing protein [Saitoella complicata NRRL Y-17804]|uniref:kinesin-domain-containing protein n=1 Tax=Saitoella complicata (strain BCRC 22490 / CBS 7301 / JCM 7358 / NBRC 10748 / NRRL Y-17804) TaxID=698492 RepID=UPI0008682195|nr:kinesin-domain-containing protein [Saitoella complicata NRRL Y-17804]ODQ53843.1 kinesin-domain-containing protein [Saitoella complicata NRRL Y-17804]